MISKDFVPLFFSLIILTTTTITETNCRARNGRRTDNVDEAVLALVEDATALRTYAAGFWKPLASEVAYRQRFYHIQWSATVKSPMIERTPDLFQRIVGTMVQKADFINLPSEVGNVMNELFEREDEILSASKVGTDSKYGDLAVNTELMELHMTMALNGPRNAKQFKPMRETIGGFIFRSMAKSGLMVMSDKFNFRKVTINDVNVEQTPTPPDMGNNLIGIIPGKFWDTPMDRIIVVGAHWDTYGVSPGYNDNGSGVAAILEAARVLASASCFKPDYSIVFVLFDAEESGCRGSQNFVASFLKPLLKAKGSLTQGAFILDTILNYDERENTQEFSKAWHQFAPEIIEAVEARGRRGDFLATVTRDDAKDLRLRKVLAKYLEVTMATNSSVTNSGSPAGVSGSHFRHEAVNISGLKASSPPIEAVVDSSHFWMSDHARFWYHMEAGQMFNYGAVLLTDTAYLRGYMRNCYHRECDTASALADPEGSFDFLGRVTQALVLAIADLATAASNLEAEQQCYYYEPPPPKQEESEDNGQAATDKPIEKAGLEEEEKDSAHQEHPVETTEAILEAADDVIITNTNPGGQGQAGEMHELENEENQVLTSPEAAKPRRPPRPRLPAIYRPRDEDTDKLMKLISVLEKSNLNMIKGQAPVRQYQPNYFGTQINVENLSLEMELQKQQNQFQDLEEEDGLLKASKAKSKAAVEKFMYLGGDGDVGTETGEGGNSNSNSISRLVSNYFGLGGKRKNKGRKRPKEPLKRKPSPGQKSRRRNSPMLIKVLKSEL